MVRWKGLGKGCISTEKVRRDDDDDADDDVEGGVITIFERKPGVRIS